MTRVPGRVLDQLVRERGGKVDVREAAREGASVGRGEGADTNPMAAVPVENVEDVRGNTVGWFRVRDEDDHGRTVEQVHGGGQRLQRREVCPVRVVDHDEERRITGARTHRSDEFTGDVERVLRPDGRTQELFGDSEGTARRPPGTHREERGHIGMRGEEMFHQSRLADARHAFDDHDDGRVPGRLVQGRLEFGELAGTSDELDFPWVTHVTHRIATRYFGVFLAKIGNACTVRLEAAGQSEHESKDSVQFMTTVHS